MTARSDAPAKAGDYPAILFKPLKVGALELPNRVLMAPLTRDRSLIDGTPHEMAITYYRQRASAGLIISEGTSTGPLAKGYIDVPGIYTDAHIAAWQAVTDAVHAAGGRIFCQLWHVGRVSHDSLLSEGEVPVAPSAIPGEITTFGATGVVDCTPPRALETDEIPHLIEEYRHATRCAMEAGFDGVEIHSANGYLLDQFIHAHTNERDDAYGGSEENRARLTVEVASAVADVIGADRVGVRLSPTGTFSDMRSDQETAFAHVIDGLGALGLAFLHFVERFPGIKLTDEEEAMIGRLRARWSGVYIANGDFDAARAAEAITSGHASAVAFGRIFLANPDLPERFRRGAPLNEPNPDTFYGGDHTGYIDYPFLD